MKQKILSLFFLTAILSLALVSAANFSILTTSPASLTKSTSQTSFLITPTIPTGQSIDIAITLPQQIVDSNNNIITLNPPYTFNFNSVINGQTQGPVAISYNSGTVPNNFVVGTFTVNANITATDTTNSSNTLSQAVPIKFINDFCTSGENGTDLSISRVDIRNDDGDDTEWKPLDSISIRVDVSNDGSDNVREVYVELGLINPSGKNIINDMDNLDNKKVNLGTINDGKSKTQNFKFNVPIDFDEEDYRLVVKAYSTASGGQKALCTAHSSDLDNSYYNSISGVRETDENKQVIIDNVILSPDVAQCGDNVQLSGEVANIGDTDYFDRIKVTLFNRELGINQNEEIDTDLEQGDSTSFTMNFNVPQNATEKTYTLEMKAYYDFDTGDDTYNLVSDKTFTKTMQVQGNCIPTPTVPKIPTITAQLDSSTPDAVAGKEVLIQATIKNNANTAQTYSVGVSGNTAWSDLISIDPNTITVPAGQSRDVSIALNINSNAQGDNDLTIKTTDSSGQTTQQSITIAVTKSGADLGPLAENLQNNWFIYVIILVNVILIIAIIAVIIKMTRPRRAA